MNRLQRIVWFSVILAGFAVMAFWLGLGSRNWLSPSGKYCLADFLASLFGSSLVAGAAASIFYDARTSQPMRKIVGETIVMVIVILVMGIVMFIGWKDFLNSVRRSDFRDPFLMWFLITSMTTIQVGGLFGFLGISIKYSANVGGTRRFRVISE